MAPIAYRARLMDVEAARVAAQARCPGGRSLLLGHSMGAATVMLEAGAACPGATQRDVSAQGDANAARKVLRTVSAFVDAVGKAECTLPAGEEGLELQAR